MTQLITNKEVTTRPFPPWIKKRIVLSHTVCEVKDAIKRFNLHTVCRSASCPNMSECFSQKRVTFMILGDICTRDCRFCGVKKGRPLGLDVDEPERISRAVEALGLKHVIITSVTRDDLEDGGAEVFSETAHRIKKDSPETHVEVLTPDFKGKEESVDKVLDSPIDIFSHNLETVARLYNTVRPQASYKRSLNILRRAKKRIKALKSGLMVGLGETRDEVLTAMRDLRNAGCGLLTIGQYLRPSKNQLDVYEFVHPDTFAYYKEEALSLGFKEVLSNPFARTSYLLSNAGTLFL